LLKQPQGTYCVAENKLTGQHPLNRFPAPSISVTDVSDNPLTGSLPPSLGLLFNRIILSARNIGLTGTLPTELGNTSLEQVDLEGNRLFGTVPDSDSGLPHAW
jgi:hypothetical protein